MPKTAEGLGGEHGTDIQKGASGLFLRKYWERAMRNPQDNIWKPLLCRWRRLKWSEAHPPAPKGRGALKKQVGLTRLWRLGLEEMAWKIRGGTEEESPFPTFGEKILLGIKKDGKY